MIGYPHWQIDENYTSAESVLKHRLSPNTGALSFGNHYLNYIQDTLIHETKTQIQVSSRFSTSICIVVYNSYLEQSFDLCVGLCVTPNVLNDYFFFKWGTPYLKKKDSLWNIMEKTDFYMYIDRYDHHSNPGHLHRLTYLADY